MKIRLGLWMATFFGDLHGAVMAAQATCSEPPLVSEVGLPTSGSVGYPELLLEGAPVTGYPVQLRVCSAPPQAPGLLLVGATLAPLDLPQYGVTVQPGNPLLIAAFQVEDEGCSPPLVQLDSVPVSLCGFEVVCQAAVLDLGAIGGVAFTLGAHVGFGAPPAGPLFPLQSTDVGEDPNAIALADFNADGHLDAVVTSNFPGSEVLLALGAGNGAFAEAQHIPVDISPYAIAAGDLNGDAFPDAVTANLNGGTVSVLIGLKGGGFAPAQHYPAGGHSGFFGPRSVAIGDLNADGKQDLAVANSWKKEVLLLYGDGSGGFAAPLVLVAGSQPYYAAIADLDLDGVQDLAVANYDSDTLTILLGTGGGAFAPGQTIFSGPFPSWIAAADIDEDGQPDLVATKRYFDPGLAFLRGVGAGQFAYPAHIQSPGGCFTVRSADFNADQNLDLIVGNESGNLLVHPGNGDGTFSPPTSFPAVASAWFETADVNEDGWLDFVLSENYLSALLSLGNGAFFQPLELSLAPGWGGWDLQLANLDGDVADDIVTVLNSSQQVAVVLRTPGGGIGMPAFYAAGEGATAVTVGDWNGDAHNDLAVANRGSVDLSVFLNRGDGTFGDGELVTVGYPSEELLDVACGDLDGDGDLDLAAANPDNSPFVDVLFGAGDGTFQAPTSVLAATSIYPGAYTIAIADVNGDGLGDLLAGMAGFWPHDEVTIMLSSGGGAFSQPTGHPVRDAWTLEVSDLNADGVLDLVSANSVFLGAGDGTFAQSVADPYPPSWQVDAIADIDGDLIPDLLRSKQTQVSPKRFLRGVGDGTFEKPTPLVGIGAPIAIGDLTGDLMPDILCAWPGDKLTLLPNGLLLGQ